MFKKKVDPLDVETEFLMKLAGVITQSAHSVAQNWTRASTRLSPPKALSPAQLCAHSLSLTGNVFKENGSPTSTDRK